MADLDLWTKDSIITNFADDTQSVIIKDRKDEAVEIAKKEANSVIDFFENNNFLTIQIKQQSYTTVEGKVIP